MGAISDGRLQVNQLIKNLNQKGGLKKVQHREHIKKFAHFYREHKPELSVDDIKFLLQGSETDKRYPRGLLHQCGATHILHQSDLKQSASFAVQVVSILLDPERNSTSPEMFREALAECNTKVFADMKLSTHILSFDKSRSSGDFSPACSLVESILEVFEGQLSLEDIVDEVKARHVYLETINDQDDDSDDSYDADALRDPPICWKDVTEADLTFDEEDPDDSFFVRPDAPDGEDGFLSTAFHDDSSFRSDPLGIISDFEVRKLVKFYFERRSAKGAKAQNSSKARLKVFGKEANHMDHRSVDTLEERFDPRAFLFLMHADTHSASLERGLTTLRETVTNRIDQMKTLVRDHFDQFVTCKETIDVLYELSRSNSTKDEATGRFRAVRLQDEIDALHKECSSLYGNVLARKRETDEIHSTLGVLKRFHFLFRIPGDMKKNIEMKEYEKVVRDYRRARSFVVKEPRPILKQVLSTVDRIVADFREKAMLTLEDPHSPYEEQEKIISYLVELDCKEDPVAYYIDRQHDWTMEQLQNCRDEQQKRLNNIVQRETTNPEAKLDQSELLTALSASSSVDHSFRKFIGDLSAVLSRNLPDMNRFHEEIRKGKFHRKREKDEDQKTRDKELMDHTTKLMLEIQESYAKDIREIVLPLGHPARTAKSYQHTTRKSEVMIHMSANEVKLQLPQDEDEGKSRNPDESGVVEPEEDSKRQSKRSSQSYSQSVSVKSLAGASDAYSTGKEAVSAKEGSTKLVRISPFMIQHVKCVVECYRRLKKMRIHKAQLDVLRHVAEDITKFFCTQIWKKSLLRLTSLPSREKWIEHELHGEVAPVVTTLPVTFQEVVDNAITQLEGIPLLVIKGEWILELIGAPFLEAMRAFCDALHELAFNPLYQTKCPSKPSDSKERRLLYIINNASYARTAMSDGLVARMKKIIPQTYHDAFLAEHKEVEKLFTALDHLAFDYYIRQKLVGLNEIVKNSFMMDGVNWLESSAPEDVRLYCHELLLKIVFIHRELYRTQKSEVPFFLERLLEKIFDNYLSYVKYIGRFGEEGAFQLFLELSFLERTLDTYTTSEARGTVHQCREALSKWVDVSTPPRVERLEGILEHCKKSNRLMYACFEDEKGSDASNGV